MNEDKESMKSEKKKKVCLIANGGGHLEQLKQLAEVYKRYDCFYVVMKTKVTNSMKEKHYFLLENSRESNFVFALKTILIFIQSFFILLKERPDVVICTGAGATISLCIIAKKIFHSKLVFIESFAKKETASMTGKFLYKYADLFIVQWKGMLKFYPNAVYGGWIY